ncbi:MAG: hypothetical protein RMJ28_06930 [Nitrososphaerota archaeon]|nr:hypothetical protein [Nitrososphaerota archaeon]
MKRWLEVRWLLMTLLAQVSFSLSASIASSSGASIGGLDPWSTRLFMLALLSALTIAVGIESGRCRHGDLAATATAIAVASQLLYTLVTLP